MSEGLTIQELPLIPYQSRSEFIALSLIYMGFSFSSETAKLLKIPPTDDINIIWNNSFGTEDLIRFSTGHYEEIMAMSPNPKQTLNSLSKYRISPIIIGISLLRNNFTSKERTKILTRQLNYWNMLFLSIEEEPLKMSDFLLEIQDSMNIFIENLDKSLHLKQENRYHELLAG